MTIAFTICSNNYISQAKALADSLRESNPEVLFYIGLADDFSGIPEQFRKSYEGYNILEVKEVEINNFDWMQKNYDIIEFNTSVKPFYFSHLMKKHPDAANFIFFDPDIYVYKSVSNIEKALETYNIVLTPHLTAPIEDSRNDFFIHEHDILNHGVFNLGFVAINHSEEARKFIKWWEERLTTQCIHDLCNGLFVDQLWCNLVPSYFDKVLIDKDPGMNMAYWNLQERTISKENGQYRVNGSSPLTFFHFSTFNPDLEDNIATKQNRYKLSDRPDLQELYADYEQKVKENHFQELKGIPCVYGKPLAKPKVPSKLAVKVGFPFKVMVNLIEKYL